MPIASFCSAGSAFPCVQLQRPTPRDISHSGVQLQVLKTLLLLQHFVLRRKEMAQTAFEPSLAYRS